jgi:hypothetical protein
LQFATAAALMLVASSTAAAYSIQAAGNHQNSDGGYIAEVESHNDDGTFRSQVQFGLASERAHYFGSVDLYTGELKVRANANAPSAEDFAGAWNASYGSAILQESVRFVGTTESVVIGVLLHFEGSFSGFGSGYGEISIAVQDGPTPLYIGRFAASAFNIVSESKLMNVEISPDDGIIDLVFALDVQVNAYAIPERKSLISGDFGNTARLSFILQPGVTFESSSGIFLTEAVPVPEPSAADLLAAGMLLLVALGRQVKRRKVRWSGSPARQHQQTLLDSLPHASAWRASLTGGDIPVPTAVPEPAPLSLLPVSLCGAAVRRRKTVSNFDRALPTVIK